MDLRRKKVLRWQILSVLWVLVVGTLLHFTYEWSGKSLIVGAFSAVNESVWEHLKLGYWSMMFFCLIEYPFIKSYANNYFIAKAIGIFAMNLFIVVFFYFYTALTGEHSLILDVISYIVGAVIYGSISYKTMLEHHDNKLNKLGLIMLAVFGALLILFTYFTPKLPIFKDSHTGSYGVD